MAYKSFLSSWDERRRGKKTRNVCRSISSFGSHKKVVKNMTAKEEEHWRFTVFRISSLLTWDLILCLQRENVTLNGWEEREGGNFFPLEFFGNSQEDRIKKIHNSLLSASTFLSLLFSLSGQILKWSLSRLFLLSLSYFSRQWHHMTRVTKKRKKEWEENEESLLCLHVRYNITTKAGLSFLRGSKKTQRRGGVCKKNNRERNRDETSNMTFLLSLSLSSWKFWGEKRKRGSPWRRITFSLTGSSPFTLISCLLCHTKEKSPLESTFLPASHPLFSVLSSLSTSLRKTLTTRDPVADSLQTLDFASWERKMSVKFIRSPWLFSTQVNHGISFYQRRRRHQEVFQGYTLFHFSRRKPPSTGRRGGDEKVSLEITSGLIFWHNLIFFFRCISLLLSV